MKRRKIALWQALFFEELDDDFKEITGRYYADMSCCSYPDLEKLFPEEIGPADSYETLKELVIKTLYAESHKYRLAVIRDCSRFNIYKERGIE